QVDELSSYHHDMFCLILHHLMSQQFLLIESCKFRFPLAILECFLMLLFEELVISQLDILHPFSIPPFLLLYLNYFIIFFIFYFKYTIFFLNYILFIFFLYFVLYIL